MSTSNGKIANIVEPFIGVVVGQPERRRRVSANAQGGFRPGRRFSARGTLSSKTVVAFGRPLRWHGGQMGGDTALRTLRDEILLVETWLIGGAPGSLERGFGP